MVRYKTSGWTWICAALLLVAGCFPSSCEREGYTALMPADSLSRDIASDLPVDTLRIAWTTEGTDAHPLAFPRTVRFNSSGNVLVSDVERNSVFAFTPEGDLAREMSLETFDAPYLTGLRDDTLVVYSAGSDRIDFVTDGRATRHVSVADLRPAGQSLFYAAATDAALYAKGVSDTADGFIARLNAQGKVEAQATLTGPHWRHAGFLRVWGDSLLSLSGFRPVVDVLPLDFTAETPVDTLALVGFDSPMLARSRAFLRGEVSKAPLLTASADATSSLLFVINLRPGWLHIDTYDRSGRLQHRITQPDPSPGREFYPRDLAVRERADGSYDIAVAFSSPAPQVTLYRWSPDQK